MSILTTFNHRQGSERVKYQNCQIRDEMGGKIKVYSEVRMPES